MQVIQMTMCNLIHRTLFPRVEKSTKSPLEAIEQMCLNTREVRTDEEQKHEPYF
jgi:hypothetical protein